MILKIIHYCLFAWKSLIVEIKIYRYMERVRRMVCVNKIFLEFTQAFKV